MAQPLEAARGGSAVGTATENTLSNSVGSCPIVAMVVVRVFEVGIDFAKQLVPVRCKSSVAIARLQGEAVGEGRRHVEEDRWAIKQQPVKGNGRPVADENVADEQHGLGVREVGS